jgi:hypothetical protein
MLPEEPAHFPSAPVGDRPWRWAMLDASGAPVEVTGEHADQSFASQGDAESWVGETWADLAEQGVDAVTLLEVDRVVYGPMSLHA